MMYKHSLAYFSRVTTDDNPYPPAMRLNVLQHVPADVQTLLDVGCNTGAFGGEFKKQRADSVVWGIEPNLGASSEAGRVLDRVISGTYPESMADEYQKFDCVVFNDVLEHMARPEEALMAAGNCLTSGGLVMAAVPNVRYIRVVLELVVRGRWTYTETGILDRTHLRFFTRHSITALFTDAGYRVERVIPLSVFGERFHLARLVRFVLRDFSHGQYLVLAFPDRDNAVL